MELQKLIFFSFTFFAVNVNARLQGQRWRNWAHTRLSHLPRGEVYTDEEVIENIRRNAWNISNDSIDMERDVPAVVIDVPENNDIVIDIEQPQDLDEAPP